MLNWIVHFSLRFRGVVTALACILTGYGLYVASHAKLDVLPNFVPPEVSVETEAPGLSPEQVEVLVTKPIENSINGLGNMASLRSESISGLSTITAVFKDGTDIFIARQMLNERLVETAGELPASVKRPVMSPLTSSTMDLLKIGLVSTNLSPMDLRSLADWEVKPRLLSIPGVARCIVFGGDVRQLQVQIQPDRLMAFGLSLNDVITAARESTEVVGAGFVENANQRILIQPEDPALTPDTLGNVVVAQSHGQSVRLREIANVVEAGAPKFGDTLIQGQPGIFLSLGSQYGANTMEATLAVEAALKDMQPLFDREQIKVYPRLHRPATFIENSLHNINHSLYLGAALVAVVLFLFLGHFRTAFISLTAIPLSLLTAIIVLDKFGITLNTITVGGLAIAIGAVVDDAIIDVENIFRRLRENQALGHPRSSFQVTLDASLEVRTAVVYATFIVALVFVPVLTLTGLQGSFFAPLALSYILAIMASLGVALTLTPALCLLFFSKGVKNHAEPALQRWIKLAYGKTLEFVARGPEILLAGGLLLCVGSLFLLKGPGDQMLPDFREGHFVLQVQAVPGTSLPEMRRLTAEITRLVLAKPEVATVEVQMGRAEQGEDTWEPNRCEFHVELKENIPGLAQAKLMDSLHDMIDGFPGIQGEVVTFLGDRISETITGESAPVVVNIYGDDLDLIDDKAKEVAAVLQSIPGGKDAQVKSPPGAPRMAIRLRMDRLTQLGFRPAEVLDAVQTAYQGTVAAQIHQGSRVTDVNVILDPSWRKEPEQIGALMVKNPAGTVIPLRDLADIYLTTGRYSILHDGASRRQVVTCTPSKEANIGSFVSSAEREVSARVKFPKGIYAVFGGDAEAAAQARKELLIHSCMAAAGILLLLIVVARTWSNLLLVLANVPFALVGGILAMWASGKFGSAGDSAMTIGSLVGFVTLFGITMRNSIMMVSHFEHLVIVEGVTWGMAAAIRGASERVVPILMTALVTAMGLLPLAMGTGEAGQEIEGPMALVILGGLITSTTLNLLILPTLALRYGKFGVKKPDEA